MYSAATPTSSNRSWTCRACLRSTQNASVGRSSPRFSHSAMMSPVSVGTSIASAKLAFVEVAGDGRDGREVGIARRIDGERREKAVANQIGRGRRDDEVVVIFAQARAPRASPTGR